MRLTTIAIGLLLSTLSLLPGESFGQSVPSGTVTSGIDLFTTSNEVLTNKVWINGKFIYRKVFNVGALPNNSTKSTAHGLTNVTFTSVYGIITNGTISMNIPFPYNPYQNSVSLQTNGSNVNITTWVDYSPYSGIIVLEYVKN